MNFRYNNFCWVIMEPLVDGYCVVPAHISELQARGGKSTFYSSGPLIVRVKDGVGTYSRSMLSSDTQYPWANCRIARNKKTREQDVSRVGFTKG